MPTGQADATDKPVPLHHVPLGHIKQVDVPLAGAYLPGVQAVQVECPPAVHCGVNVQEPTAHDRNTAAELAGATPHLDDKYASMAVRCCVERLVLKLNTSLMVP